MAKFLECTARRSLKSPEGLMQQIMKPRMDTLGIKISVGFAFYENTGARQTLLCKIEFMMLLFVILHSRRPFIYLSAYQYSFQDKTKRDTFWMLFLRRIMTHSTKVCSNNSQAVKVN